MITEILKKLSFKQRRRYVGTFSYKNFRGVITDDALALFNRQEVQGKSAFRGYYASVDDAVRDIDNGLT